MDNKKISVAMVDDHTIFRQGISKLLAGVPGIILIMDVGSGEELIKELHADPRKIPDVLLLDIEMSGMKGFEVMTILHDLWPQIKVVGLSAYENEYSIIRLFRLGAMGYLRKGCDLDEIQTAIRLVNEGHFYYDDPVSRELIHHIQRGHKYPEITDRELEFMRYCCTEMKYKEIAVAMQVSERTVDGYRESLCHKLKLESRAGLIMFALSSGVVSAKQFHIQ